MKGLDIDRFVAKLKEFDALRDSEMDPVSWTESMRS